MRRIDRRERDAEEYDGEANDARLEGDVEADYDFGETGCVGCYAEGADWREDISRSDIGLESTPLLKEGGNEGEGGLHDKGKGEGDG